MTPEGHADPPAWRRTMLAGTVALVHCVSACRANTAPTAVTAQASTPPTPAQALRAIFEAEWDHDLRDQPTWASTLGDHRFDDQWQERSLTAYERRHAHDEEVLKRLHGFPRDTLSTEDLLDLDLFTKLRADAVEAYQYGLYLLPIDHIDGVQVDNELADQLRFETVRDFESWIARLARFGTYVDETIELMREGIRRKIVYPRVIMDRVPSQLQAQIVRDPADSPFFKPLRALPPSLPEEVRARLAREARAHILAEVVPAFLRFQAFFSTEYLAAAPAEVGVSHFPRGDETYAYLARHHTTTDRTPRQIHEIGLAEVSRIKSEMQKLMKEAHYDGSLGDFFAFLRTDPRFYEKRPEDLLADYRRAAARVNPLLSTMFNVLPRIPYVVEPIPEASAPQQTTAYYRPPAADGSRPGAFMVNLYKRGRGRRWPTRWAR